MRLFRVTLMERFAPPEDRDEPLWCNEAVLLVRAEDHGSACARAEAFFDAVGKVFCCSEVSVEGEGTDDPDVFRVFER